MNMNTLLIHNEMKRLVYHTRALLGPDTYCKTLQNTRPESALES